MTPINTMFVVLTRCVLCTCILIGVTQGLCTTSTVTQCYSNIMYRYQNSPTDESQVSAYCSAASQMCSNNVTECATCSSADQPTCFEFLGYQSAINYLCTSADARKVFLQYRTCIATNVDNLVTKCRQAQQENCPGYNAAFKCFYADMKTTCNDAAARTMVQFELKRFGPWFQSLGCTIDTSSYISAADSLSAGLTIMIAAAAAVLMRPLQIA
jgi:hypothetical protein